MCLLTFIFKLFYLGIDYRGKTCMFCSLERKFFEHPRISLTYYILRGILPRDTKCRCFVV
jgi:hypothetical protein